jgi:hypothetical protein
MGDIDYLIPRKGLIAAFDARMIGGVADGGDVGMVPASFGTAHDFTCASSKPTYLATALNGLPVVSWNGTKNPLGFSGAIAPKYIFIIAAFNGADFGSDYQGLVSDLDVNVIFVGQPGTAKFFNSIYGEFRYRKGDTPFAESNMAAAMNGVYRAYEMSLGVNWSLDGLQIGQDRNISTRKLNGKVPLALAYDRIPSDEERFDLHAYAAMTWRVWRANSSEVDIWPFQPNWSRTLPSDKVVLSSASVSGNTKERSKTPARKTFEPKFETRDSNEYDTAFAFWDAKYPGQPVIYRDDAFRPYRDVPVKIVSPLAVQQDDYQDFTYSLQMRQTGPETIFADFTPPSGSLPAVTALTATPTDETTLLLEWDDMGGNAGGSEVVTFLGEPVTFMGQPVTFTPQTPGTVKFLGEPVTFLGENVTFNP